MALTKVKSGMRTLGTGEVATANMATDPTNADNLSSGSVPLAQLGNAPATDLTGLEDDIALIGFKVAANGSLAKYNLVDQTVDDFQDASGIDASASTDEQRSSSGNYYSGLADVTATGGTITTDGDYTIHSFSQAQSGTNYVNDTTQSTDYLIIAGGGGGGDDIAGAGGAGGYRYFTGVSVAAGTYAVTVGSGGTGANGTDSVFNSQTSTGGGKGGTRSSYAGTGGSGGGGGGVSSTYIAGAAGNTPSTSPVQGYAGGDANGSRYNGGGGGGAGGAGGDGTIDPPSNPGGNGGAGGLGLSNSITGTAVMYASGGGGGYGGGGAKGIAPPGGGGDGDDEQGTDGLGGGGGGASGGGGGGRGGHGIVIIRHPSAGVANDMTLISNATTAESTPTKGDMVMTYTNGAGTNTINTDIKGYVSRDNGTTWTQGTLASQGTTGGHTIVTFHDLDISSQPSGTSMKYKIETLNQTASKVARIQAVSLGWS